MGYGRAPQSNQILEASHSYRGAEEEQKCNFALIATLIAKEPEKDNWGFEVSTSLETPRLEITNHPVTFTACSGYINWTGDRASLTVNHIPG